MQDLEVALSEMHDLNENVAVVCLSEHFIKRGDEKYLNINNFYLGAIYSRLERRGGTCILCKKGFECVELDVVKEFAIDKHFEICGVEIKQLKLTIICIYRIPNSDINIFFDNFTKVITKLQHKKCNIVVCGDFNIDLLLSDKTSTAFKELMLNYGLEYHIHEPTRLNKCIDNIISNIHNVTGKTYNLYLSDHNTAQLIKIEQKASNRVEVDYCFMTINDLNKENVAKFVDYISCISFSEIYGITDTNEAFDKFHDLLTLFYKLCFPCIRVKMKHNSSKPKWITKGIKKSCNTKRSLRYKYYLNQNNDNKKKYKAYSKLLRKCMNNLQSLCNEKYITSSRNKIKATWDVVKRNLCNEPFREYISKIIDGSITFTSGSDIANKFNNHFIDISNNNENCTLTSKSDIANKFNNHFVDITNNKDNCTLISGSDIANKLNNNLVDISNNNDNSSTLKHNKTDIHKIKSNDKSIFVEPTNDSEIYRIIMSIKNTKSAGYDDITTELIKKIAQHIASPLAHIVNLSLEQGCFPNRLKLSLIKPLYKKGSKLDVDNYRPIALTPIISKIFEKIIYMRVMKFLSKHNILVDQQYGFRQNKSTTLAIFTLVKAMMTNINDKITTCALLLDLSKAFDRVDHARLLEKLERYGIRGPAKEWFQSYLTDRKQVTRLTKLNKLSNTLENFDSEARTNCCGVPQGSILGPLLFLIYINDLPQSIKHQCVLFADDTTIIIKCKNLQNIDIEIKQTLNDIKQWLDINKLKINISKTNVLHCKTSKSKPIRLNVALNNNNIEQVHNAKFLGVTLDEHFTWKNHIKIISKKINQFVFALKRIKMITSLRTAIMVYHAYVCSVIRYGIVVWGNSSELAKIFIAQKKCIRAIFKMQWSDSCRPIFKSHNLLTVPCIYIYEVARFVRSNLELFERKDNTNKRKPTHLDFELPVPKLEIFRRSCVYMAPLIYNALPRSITQLPFNKFCVSLRKWLLQECFYSIDEFFRKCPCKFYTIKHRHI